MITSEMILQRLPPYLDEWELVKETQYVPDIINEVCTAHKLFSGHYDRFSELFYDTDPAVVCDNLYDFCRRYIRYREESVKEQTSAVPAGILTRGHGDCKHYALFCAGVIGSLNRLYGCCFVGSFYFVAYRRAKEPYHVFVSVKDSENDTEIWIDPTPGSGGKPTLIVSKPV